ncbi:acetamidase [Komagataeibacter nataicola]|uniref:Acetamidase n=1 Tax=Komagataeibacter nataicola TaxID=265960 RepID=A0A9N7H3L2_9PROT|nr:acetamidase/formamidase family protein [Komagataeibacter nataicola]AQU88623.1 acetamidase [Komagataeibacter nataicola]PYD64887.1 acetamidase [Komagataeibacter nataicola]WEQ57129.1 acetamidase/formamidase family protein [Komagataeibacter nataicola]WNM08670.1 acetamidase/formamidase family protein [Komagataeibacter nataicola]GBR26784.1 putative acetamidase [Komagataeibacter nataicola NRIC 0616]
MCQSCVHTIHHHKAHFGWNRDTAPVHVAMPGDVLCFECADASGGQIDADATARTLATLDFGRINPLNGPVYVEGAQPGDALKITVNRFYPSGQGWTANIPGFGLLADQFPEPSLYLWRYDPVTLEPALFGHEGVRVPLKPFIGTIGAAPAEPGPHSVVPPRRVGGNMDLRDIAEGSVLYLPVEVEGALLSLGDTHAAQGDGEVCGTAIESAMNVEIRVELLKRTFLPAPRLTTSGPVTRHLDGAGYEVTIGLGPDLFQAARESVSRMIDLLSRLYGISPVNAYMLCSVCGDLRISEIVDVPNFIVSFYFPRIVFP